MANMYVHLNGIMTVYWFISGDIPPGRLVSVGGEGGVMEFPVLQHHHGEVGGHLCVLQHRHGEVRRHLGGPLQLHLGPRPPILHGHAVSQLTVVSAEGGRGEGKGEEIGGLKITVVDNNFSPSKITIVLRKFGPSKITVVDRIFGSSKTMVLNRIKLRLWSLILDWTKLQLLNVILDRQKLLLCTIILVCPKLWLWTVILDATNLRLWRMVSVV